MTTADTYFETDRRKNERHSISGTAWFQWKDAAGTKQEQTGSLRNVSSNGLFIETASPPPAGSDVLVQFHFDSASHSPTASITTRGHVKRVEAGALNEQESGFAISTRRMNLHRVSGTPDEGDD
jgi:PilZ domain